MLRVFLLLLLGTLLVLDQHGPDLVHGVAGLTAAEGSADSDCCPKRPGESEQDGDCCDFDLGRCCATGLVALAPAPPAVLGLRLALDEQRSLLPARLQRARAAGPPPTPPPIG